MYVTLQKIPSKVYSEMLKCVGYFSKLKLKKKINLIKEHYSVNFPFFIYYIP